MAECLTVLSDLRKKHDGTFSYSKTASESNDNLLHIVEFLNMHSRRGSSNATRLIFGKVHNIFVSEKAPSKICVYIGK